MGFSQTKDGFNLNIVECKSIYGGTTAMGWKSF